MVLGEGEAEAETWTFNFDNGWFYGPPELCNFVQVFVFILRLHSQHVKSNSSVNTWLIDVHNKIHNEPKGNFDMYWSRFKLLSTFRVYSWFLWIYLLTWIIRRLISARSIVAVWSVSGTAHWTGLTTLRVSGTARWTRPTAWMLSGTVLCRRASVIEFVGLCDFICSVSVWDSVSVWVSATKCSSLSANELEHPN